MDCTTDLGIDLSDLEMSSCDSSSSGEDEKGVDVAVEQQDLQQAKSIRDEDVSREQQQRAGNKEAAKLLAPPLASASTLKGKAQQRKPAATSSKRDLPPADDQLEAIAGGRDTFLHAARFSSLFRTTPCADAAIIAGAGLKDGQDEKVMDLSDAIKKSKKKKI